MGGFTGGNDDEDEGHLGGRGDVVDVEEFDFFNIFCLSTNVQNWLISFFRPCSCLGCLKDQNSSSGPAELADGIQGLR